MTLQHTVIKESSWAVFFDYFLSMALYYFEEQRVDFVLLEGGIGGRYDSTNFIDRGLSLGTHNDTHTHTDTDNDSDELVVPLVAVITNISIDHQSVLGYSIEEITMQKCGIIKPGSHVFTCVTSQQESVMHIIRRECVRLGAALYEVDTQSMSVCAYDPNRLNRGHNGTETETETETGLNSNTNVNAAAAASRHIDTASENRALASAVLLYLTEVGCIGTSNYNYNSNGCDNPLPLPHPLVTAQSLDTLPEHMLDGFFWPCRYILVYICVYCLCNMYKYMYICYICRMEKFNVPFRSASPSTVEVILDGCHNGYSVYRFMDTMGRAESNTLEATQISPSHSHTQSPVPLIITLFGCGMEKENIVREMVDSVCRTSDTIILVRSTHFKAMSVSKLYEYIPQEYRHKIKVVDPDVSEGDSNPHVTYVSHVLSVLLTSTQFDNLIDIDLSRSKVTICGSLFIAAEAREYLYE